jgi:hypothetical protein
MVDHVPTAHVLLRADATATNTAALGHSLPTPPRPPPRPLGRGIVSTLRGFGMTFDCASGGFRNWYLDSEGAKRWADNDELVTGLNGLQEQPIPGEGEG